MRWKHIDKDPEEGDIRIQRKFLLLPKCIDDEWRWLEWTAWTEKYVWRTSSIGIYEIDWVPISWKD